MPKMCVTQKCRIWPSEQNSSIIGENLTHLAEDLCTDYSNINVWSGPCCGFYVTSMYTAVPIPVIPIHNASAASKIEEFLTVFFFKRPHLSIPLHRGVQQCSTFKIGYTSVNSGSACQIIHFFCNILGDISSSNTSFHTGGCQSLLYVVCLQQPLLFVSIAAQKCPAECNGALGFWEACETLDQSAVGFPVFPTVTSNIYHL